MNKMRRTDLALEIRESFQEDVEIEGVVLRVRTDKKREIKVSTVIIKTEQGSEKMGKPIGTYITMEAPHLEKEDKNYHEPLANEIKKYVKELAGGFIGKSVLVAGLGNREVTSDSLGPKVVDNLFVTRHLIREFGQEFKEKNALGNVSAVAPGVMAQTGMESAEILNGIIEKTKPDILIVIDALAARSLNRLNTTIQITNTGIAPGSGVGNHRKALNKETLGIDVIAIGVPTVVGASTIVEDRMEEVLQEQGFTENEIENFLMGIKNETMKNMFVTPKNVDESIRRISYTISDGLNACFH